MDKKEKKEILKKYSQDQKRLFTNSLPFDLHLFSTLFDFLDKELSKSNCDDTLKFTIEFLNSNGLPLEKSLNWFRENGGFCDCEVLANIEDKIAEL